MPQISQLPVIFFSQLFWLLVVFGIIFFGRLEHGMVDAFEASLVYLVATTVAVAAAAALLPGRPRAVADAQPVAVATSSSAAV